MPVVGGTFDLSWIALTATDTEIHPDLLRFYRIHAADESALQYDRALAFYGLGY